MICIFLGLLVEPIILFFFFFVEKRPTNLFTVVEQNFNEPYEIILLYGMKKKREYNIRNYVRMYVYIV